MDAHGVLVVDDEPAVLGMLSTALRAFGWAVWSADSGPAAVRLYQEHEADIDVVLLDVRMPDMDGPGTLDKLRGVDSAVRAVFMTGDSRPYTHDELRRRAGSRVMTKPFKLDALSAALRAAADPAG